MMLLRPKDRIILALDVDTLDEVFFLLDRVGDSVGLYKVGLQLLTKAGPTIFSEIAKRFPTRGYFYDAKFHDIPNTVGNAVRNVALIEGVDFMSVHISGGHAMMKAAVENRSYANILGITALTSMDDSDCQAVFNTGGREKAVENLVLMALDAGIQGIVCSPNELGVVNKEDPNRRLTRVVPGIRPAWASKGDQKAVNTPYNAIRQGATYLVVGRPIRQHPGLKNPREAVQAVVDEIEQAQADMGSPTPLTPSA